MLNWSEERNKTYTLVLNIFLFFFSFYVLRFYVYKTCLSGFTM